MEIRVFFFRPEQVVVFYPYDDAGEFAMPLTPKLICGFVEFLFDFNGIFVLSFGEEDLKLQKFTNYRSSILLLFGSMNRFLTDPYLSTFCFLTYSTMQNIFSEF